MKNHDAMFFAPLHAKMREEERYEQAEEAYLDSDFYKEDLDLFTKDEEGNPNGKTEEEYHASKEYREAVDSFADDLADPNYGRDYDDYDHEPALPERSSRWHF